MKIHSLWLGLLIGMAASCQQKPVEDEGKVEKFVLSENMLSTTEIDVAAMFPLKSEILLTGKVAPDANKLIEIFPLVGGSVQDVKVELGDYVQKGQVLAVIKSSEIAGFDQQLIEAQSNLLLAQKSLNVAEDLFESKLNAERDLLSAQKEVEKAQAEFNRISEVFKIYNIGKQSDYIVKAPISGFIIEKNINRDMQLRSDKADNIFTISQIDEVWVIASVYEADISRMKEGYKAEVTTLSYPDKVFTGKIDKIFNIIDPASKTMKVRIKLDNRDYSLKPEMNATVRIFYQEDQDMLAVPNSAIIFDKSRNYVMVFKDRYNLETREVSIFKTLGKQTYIAGGLQEGERVISRNQLLIYDALND